MRFANRSFRLVTASLWLLAACGGGGDDGTGPTPSFTLSLSPASLSLEAGSPDIVTANAGAGEAAAVLVAAAISGNVTVNIVRSGGFEGPVTVTVEGLPTGVTAGSMTIGAGATSGTITVTAGPTASAGNSNLTVRGTGAGVTARTATLQLTVTLPPSIAIAAAPNAITVPQGQNGNSTLNITRTSFTGTVNLTWSGAPAGLTLAFNPAATTGNSSAITATVGAGVAPGAYVITMTAMGTGVPTANNDITVTVTAAPAIALALNPNALSIQQGDDDNTALAITRTNFAGTVNLTSTGAPANVTVSFNPAAANGTASTVTVTVGAGVAPGLYPITIRGNGTGLTEATVVLQLTVTASGGGGNVTFTFCAQSGQPLWVGFKNLGGAWTQSIGAAGVYSFTINPRGVVAWVMQDGANTRLQVVYGSSQDLNLQGASFCQGNGSVKTITGTATSIPGGDIATLFMGGAAATLFAPGPFQLDGVPDGLQDLIGVRSTIAALPLVNTVTFLRDQNLANNADVGTFDLGSGVAPALLTATINNLGADQQFFQSIFQSRNGTSVPLFTSLPDVSASQPWRGVPTASTIAGDWHLQNVVATPNGNMTGFPFRSLSQYNQTAADRTYALPPYLTTPPTINVNGTAPYVTFTSSWTIQSADFNRFWSLTLTPASGSVSSVQIMGSDGYFGGGPVQLDLDAFGAGFNAAWGMQPGIVVNWNFLAVGGAGNAGQITEGATGTAAGVAGSFTP